MSERALRIRHAIDRMRTTLGALEIAVAEVEHGVPIGAEAAQALTQTAVEIAMECSRIDAVLRAEGRR